MTKTVVYLRPSEKPEKKYKVYISSSDGKRGKIIHFGAKGMSDFTKHKDVERMKRYSARHKRGGENWTKTGIRTAGFWSKWLLWNKPSIVASKKNISSRFGVVFKSGWPSKETSSKKSSSKKPKTSSKKSSSKKPKTSSKKSSSKKRSSKKRSSK